ncbi:DUF5071 domain-containing protein [Rhizobium bangladeshense]|uniref:DUF5071 domain-containing protein n=1 Tax=Rhizobium bangladeshense TaxID=1138189 RepID=UPI001C835768|nr:DUF5071 domain-containing protein [Rhizobium bangladeshense]MBX4888768.1 DUF5071 domain-containing protein [Rhizobium bangladeshense]MBX4896566.1 DUF5071 domain-containing protein [Rhizobium bangladeshense]MBX4900635.1 DUF5071 domain-containing protein [Rhizobium bangladeshense]MBX4912842.1 DUF5071 domain-containing protein [Rhizobium bangladeshense]MBX4919397.1 DUF5071 domain-containing protein [Rhizobium bangladeshense]
MDIKSLVPRDKHDLAAVSAVEKAGYPAVAPILDDLLSWIADGNWPVARPLARFLASLGDPIVEPVVHVLAGKDSAWKYFCLDLVVRHLRADSIGRLHEVLCQLAINPNDDDRAEGVDAVAREVLA